VNKIKFTTLLLPPLNIYSLVQTRALKDKQKFDIIIMINRK